MTLLLIMVMKWGCCKPLGPYEVPKRRARVMTPGEIRESQGYSKRSW
jgi:hypothetical protein